MIKKSRTVQHDRLSKDSIHQDVRLKNLHGDALKSMKETVKDEVQRELYDWVILQPPERYAALSEGSGNRLSSLLFIFQAHKRPDERKSLRPGDHFNVLLRVRGLDPHQDSPVEILHTVLLGQDKYIWHATTKQWDKEQDALFALRLESSSIDGLSIPPIRARYLLQYKNSLIGKHFKTLQQVGVFHLDSSLVSPMMFDLWKANGELGAYLWMPEIDDLEQYLVRILSLRRLPN